MYLKVSKFFAIFSLIFSIYYFRFSLVPVFFLINLLLLWNIEKLKKGIKNCLYFFSFLINFFSLIILFYMVNNIPKPVEENMIYISANYPKNSYVDLINEFNNFDKYHKQDTLEKLNNGIYDDEIIANIDKSKNDRNRIFTFIENNDFKYPAEYVNKYSYTNMSKRPQEKWRSLLIIYNFEIYEIKKILEEKDYNRAKVKFNRLLEISKKLSSINKNVIGLAVCCRFSTNINEFYLKNRKEFDMDTDILNYIEEVSKNIHLTYKNTVVTESYLIKNMIRYYGENKTDFQIYSEDLETKEKKHFYFPIRWPFLIKSETISRLDKLYEEYYALSLKDFYIAENEIDTLIKSHTENKVFPNLLHNPYGDLYFTIHANNFSLFHYSKEKALSSFEAVKYILKKEREIPIDRLSGERFIVEENRIKSPFIKEGKNAIDIEF